MQSSGPGRLDGPIAPPENLDDARLSRRPLSAAPSRRLRRRRPLPGPYGPPDMPVVRVPFDAVRRIEGESEYKSPCDEPARERPPRAGTDVAYARSGDAFAGTWVSAAAGGVGLEAGGKKSLVPWEDLVVL